MCQSIWLDDREIDTVGAARAAFPHGLVFDIDADAKRRPPTDDECLCWLDMGATADLNGYRADNQHGGDPFEWIFRRRTQPTSTP